MQYFAFFIIILGVVTCFIAVAGMIKFNDFFTKAHAAGLSDVCGCGLILLGIMLGEGLNVFFFKLLLLIFIILITSPTSTYILAKLAANNDNKDE